MRVIAFIQPVVNSGVLAHRSFSVGVPGNKEHNPLYKHVIDISVNVSYAIG
jgi:hypothetical protein